MRRLEIYYKNDLLDIPEDETVPITKQVNDIGDLNVFKSDFAHEFRVKRTRQMNKLFENAGVLTYQTNLPYHGLDVKVVSEGIEVMPKGKMVLNRADYEFFYCSIYSGARDLFALLNQRKFTSLDLDDLNHTWDAETARDSVLNDEDYQYLMTDFSDDGELIEVITAPNEELIAEERILRPFVRVSRLFNDILSKVNLLSDIATDGLFLDMFLCIETLKPPKSATIPFLVERYHDGSTSLGFRRLHLGHTVIVDDMGVSNAYEYTAKFDGTFRFSFMFTPTNNVISIYVKINEGEPSEQTIEPKNTITWQNFMHTYTFSVEVNTNDTIRFFYTPIIFTEVLGDYYFKCYDIEADKIGLGSPVITGAHLPSITQAEFIKAICKFFGLVPDFDPVSNTLELWNINRLLTNRRIARDWSRYLNVDSMDISYRMDYARRNHMKWKPDDDVPEGSGDSFITVSDENLEMEKDLMDMPFSFSAEVIHGGQAMCRIGWFETIPGSVEYKELERVSPRLAVRAVVEDNKTTYKMSEPPNTEFSINAPNGRASRSVPLDMSISIGYNSAIVEMLNRSKILRLEFNLPEREIAGLKHYIPVYLEQYGAAFFVKKVDNWVSGQLCNVELIRI